MKKNIKDRNNGDMRPEYDLASMKGGVRGKYYERYRKGTNIVLLEPDVAEASPTKDVATVRHLMTSMESEYVSEVTLSVWLPRLTTDISQVRETVPELQKDLQRRWPVAAICDSRRRRNPSSLTQVELSLIIGLSAPLLKSLGDKLCNEAADWLKNRFRSSKTKRARALRKEKH